MAKRNFHLSPGENKMWVWLRRTLRFSNSRLCHFCGREEDLKFTHLLAYQPDATQSANTHMESRKAWEVSLLESCPCGSTVFLPSPQLLLRCRGAPVPCDGPWSAKLRAVISPTAGFVLETVLQIVLLYQRIHVQSHSCPYPALLQAHFNSILSVKR